MSPDGKIELHSPVVAGECKGNKITLECEDGTVYYLGMREDKWVQWKVVTARALAETDPLVTKKTGIWVHRAIRLLRAFTQRMKNE